MKVNWLVLRAAPLLATALAGQVTAAECKQVQAQIVSAPTLIGCTSPISLCTSGTIDGNLGLNGTTYFTADSFAAGPGTAPNAAFTISYSGVLVITTPQGTLTTRDTGVFDTSAGGPPGGFFSSFDVVTGGTGKFAGTTGSLFIGGKTVSGQFVTRTMVGEVCFP